MPGSSLARLLEPEVMDTAEEAAEYDAMDHANVNQRFVADLLALGPDVSSVLDVGTGTALIPIELAKKAAAARILAIDLAASMLAVARKNVDAAELTGRVELAHLDAKSIEVGRTFSCVVSNSIIHHIPDPSLAFSAMCRVLRPGGWMFVRDLARPVDDATVTQLVQTYAANETKVQRDLFDASLRAALTVDEVREIVAGLGVPSEAVGMTSDRHWTLAFRAPDASPAAT